MKNSMSKEEVKELIVEKIGQVTAHIQKLEDHTRPIAPGVVVRFPWVGFWLYQRAPVVWNAHS